MACACAGCAEIAIGMLGSAVTGFAVGEGVGLVLLNFEDAGDVSDASLHRNSSVLTCTLTRADGTRVRKSLSLGEADAARIARDGAFLTRLSNDRSSTVQVALEQGQVE